MRVFKKTHAITMREFRFQCRWLQLWCGFSVALSGSLWRQDYSFDAPTSALGKLSREQRLTRNFVVVPRTLACSTQLLTLRCRWNQQCFCLSAPATRRNMDLRLANVSWKQPLNEELMVKWSTSHTKETESNGHENFGWSTFGMKGCVHVKMWAKLQTEWSSLFLL